MVQSSLLSTDVGGRGSPIDLLAPHSFICGQRWQTSGRERHQTMSGRWSWLNGITQYLRLCWRYLGQQQPCLQPAQQTTGSGRAIEQRRPRSSATRRLLIPIQVPMGLEVLTRRHRARSLASSQEGRHDTERSLYGEGSHAVLFPMRSRNCA